MRYIEISFVKIYFTMDNIFLIAGTLFPAAFSTYVPNEIY